MDNYAYATTGPIYVNVADKKPRSPRRRKIFCPRGFSARSKSLNKYPDWNSPQEKGTVMQRLHEAQRIYTAME